MGEPIIRWPEEGYRRAPYAVFHDPDIYKMEMEKIFRGPVWNFVGLEAEIPEPGDFKTTFVGETPVIVTRAEDGTLHVLENRCAHRGSLLCLETEGKKRNGFTCVYHAWGYNLKGDLTSVAFRRGVRGQGGLPDDFKMSEHPLKRLRVESYRGMIYATFSDKVESLVDYLGVVTKAFDRTLNRPIKILGYDHQIIHANWKAYGENTRDSYHANILHSFFGTFGLTRHSQDNGMFLEPRGRNYYSYSKSGTEQKTDEYEKTAETLRSVQSDFSLSDPSVIQWKDEFGDGASTYFAIMYPPAMIAQVSNCLQVRQLIPKGPEKCELIYTYFGFEDDTPEMTEMRLKQINLLGSAGMVSMEDGAVAEFVAKATIGSDASSFMEMGGKGLDGGDYKLSERPLRNYWNVYRELMGI